VEPIRRHLTSPPRLRTRRVADLARAWSTRRRNRSARSRGTREGQLASGDRGLLGDEGPAFPGCGEQFPAGWAGLAAGLLARDPHALEPTAAAGAVQRGVQRDPHPGKVISPVPCGAAGCGARPWRSFYVLGNRLSGEAGKLPGGNVDLVKPD
jgi:hypothetical protein